MAADKMAVIDQVKAEGATGRVRKELRQKLLAEHEQTIIKLLKDGKSAAEIASEMNLRERPIRNLAREHGINLDRRFRNGMRGRVLGAEDQKIIAKRIWNGDKATAIAKEYGVQVRSVYRAQEVMEGRVKLKRYQNAGDNGTADSQPGTT
jgi:hypothetical protein